MYADKKYIIVDHASAHVFSSGCAGPRKAKAMGQRAVMRRLMEEHGQGEGEGGGGGEGEGAVQDGVEEI